VLLLECSSFCELEVSSLLYSAALFEVGVCVLATDGLNLRTIGWMPGDRKLA
jgi:hypothetical protein